MPDLAVVPSDQSRALWLSTFAFTLCFAVWTIFSIIGMSIKAELGLSDFQFGVLVATPILTGSLTRLVLGVWTERWGGRIVFSLQMILIDDMYQLMAIANYEDRFVVPTTHRELVEDAYDLRGGCGFTDGNGCSTGTTGVSLFSGGKKFRSPQEFIKS